MKINNNNDIQNKIISHINDNGINTTETKEIINMKLNINKTYCDIIKDFELDLKFVNDFIKISNEFNASNEKSKMLLRNDLFVSDYNMTKYILTIYDFIINIQNYIDIEGTESRNLFSKFIDYHCFISIHALIRDNKINLIVNMRSCNAKHNLSRDIFVCAYFSDILRQTIKNKYNIDLNDKIKIQINIGSIHIFKNKTKKEELKNANK